MDKFSKKTHLKVDLSSHSFLDGTVEDDPMGLNIEMQRNMWSHVMILLLV